MNVAASRWNTADEFRFEVNLALVPRPWWEFATRFLLDPVPKAPRFHDGLFGKQARPERRHDARMHPVLGRDGWSIRDAASAAACAGVLRDELTTVVIPELAALQSREAFLGAQRRERGGGQA